MNRKQRRAAGEVTAKIAENSLFDIYENAYHWGEVKRIKQEYDRLSDDEKTIRKPAMAAEIDGHLAALLA